MKTSPLILLFLFFTAIGWAEIRPWTDKNGNTVKAEIIAAYGSSAFLKDENKVTFQIPIKILRREDIADIVEWSKTEQPKLRNRGLLSDATSNLALFLSKNLVVRREGKKRLVKLDTLEMKEPQFYAFYFSGHWCAPCRRFTPTLVTFYNKMRERGYNNFELIFVSSDLSSSKMRGYMKEAKMPWPAIRYTKTENKLIQKYSGRGIPCLVVTDHEGNILLHSYKGEEYVGPRTVLKEFYPILEWSNKIQESEAHVSL